MCELFLCLEGGGTKTESLLCDGHGRVLGRGVSGAGNALSTGVDAAVRHVLEATGQALCGRSLSSLTAAFLFVPGFEYALRALPPDYQAISPRVLSDALSAYYACLQAPGGIVVQAGTGSFAFGVDESEQEYAAGGWGHILGDEGSGYAIGRAALRHILLLKEENAPQTPLDAEVAQALGIESRYELVRKVYDPSFDRRCMAALCPAVSKAAAQGDEGAVRILRVAAVELAQLAQVVNARMSAKSRPVSLSGGVAGCGEPLLSAFREAVQSQSPPLSYTPRRFSPLYGGMIYLMRTFDRTPHWIQEGEPLC